MLESQFRHGLYFQGSNRIGIGLSFFRETASDRSARCRRPANPAVRQANPFVAVNKCNRINGDLSH
jgi:hypothetical protein